MASRALTPLTRPRNRTPAFQAALDPFWFVNSLISDVVTARPSDGGNMLIVQPRMNIDDTGNEVRVTAELPGVTQGDVQIMLDDDILIIAGEKRDEREIDDRDVRLVERVFGRFQRAIQLPFSPRPEMVDARFKNGVLTITIPKNAEQRSRQQMIEVKEDAGSSESGAPPSQSSAASPSADSTQGTSGDQAKDTQAGATREPAETTA